MTEEKKNKDQIKQKKKLDAYGGAMPETKPAKTIDTMAGEPKEVVSGDPQAIVPSDPKEMIAGELGSVVGASVLYENNNALLQKIHPRGATSFGIITGTNPGLSTVIGRPRNPIPPQHFYKLTSLKINYALSALAPVILNPFMTIFVIGDKKPLYVENVILPARLQNTTIQEHHSIPLNLIITNNMRVSVAQHLNYSGGSANSFLVGSATINGYLKETNLSLAWGENAIITVAEISTIAADYFNW